MANSAQARKRVRQNERRRVCNVSMKSEVGTALKKFRAAVTSGDKTLATDTMKALQKLYGRMIATKRMQKNKAARLISQMNKNLKGMA